MRHKLVATLSTAAVLAGGLIGLPAVAAPSGAVINEADCIANPLAANDDSSTAPVLLPFKVNFYGSTYDRLYVNNNGNVTFDTPLSTYTPFGLAGTRAPIIAPFFADVDTRGGGGYVGYGWGTTLYENRPAFCVSWKSVGYYNNHSDKQNTFQMLLVQHGSGGDLDIVFNYDQVRWETGDASGGSNGLGGSSARVGFSNGSGEAGTFFEMPGSGVPGAFLDSSSTGLSVTNTDSAQRGRHVFRIRGGYAPLTRYVALGDSYSSGYGMGGYARGTHPDTWGGVNDCQRSDKAYSNLVAQELRLNLDFHACQGAVTEEFYQSREGGAWGEKPQLDHLDTNDVRLLTFTIGGNDSGFADIYEECVLGMELLPWNTCNGDDKVTKPLAAAMARLDGGADGGDAAIAKIHPYPSVFGEARRRTPYAQRVVVGYPTFFRQGGADTTFRCQGIKRVDQAWMHDKTVELNKIIKRNAELNGFRYVDPNEYFQNHEFCGTDGSWFYGVTDDGAVHPTPPGHEAIAKAILEELTNDSRPHFMVKPNASVTTSIAVGQALQRLAVGIEWPGSDIQLTLTSPSGTVYDRTARPGGASGSHGPTWDQLSIPNPEPGTWTATMFGADVDPLGEEARLSVAQLEAPNKAPVADFDVAFTNGALMLDATRAADADGTIQSYDWYVQLADGTERVLHGVRASTALPAGQQFKVTLAVRDDDGTSTYAARTAVAATMDVKPGSADNPVNIKSKGVTPVAILSTAGFDATAVQPSSVRVGPAGIAIDKSAVQDVNGDGRADLLVHVSTTSLGLRGGDTSLALSGTLRTGVPFVGSDRVRVLQ
ncbi:nidogen-like domain-containing protein [Jidongwangia harbinensis]|uniref:nidogen-like domain-containing protein n=1 Tax=Jidongwangia harbinensis TaxID=2878561 RepID=UPI001CDA2750|nr:nidogen-like domain-containing protein [Jidongwangia harbinensis]MCA2215541.1 GDSL-type esterase/lipase family protein [Jidongwangia harbinensis]